MADCGGRELPEPQNQYLKPFQGDEQAWPGFETGGEPFVPVAAAV
ncbi:MAG: hypothetical protein WCJ64_16405 [Rhodospirillaceae bacterium]